MNDTAGYFARPEVSNSDLSWLRLELLSAEERHDFTQALRIGTLTDAMITEPARVNYYTFTLDGEQYTPAEFAECSRMKEAFRRDEFCRNLLLLSTGQMEMSRRLQFDYAGFLFELTMRCKYDLWSERLRWGGDIKSTAATTQRQFEEAVRHFDYDRQRVTYMKISDAPKDMVVGISKVNGKIFKVPIERGGELWRSGEEKLTDLAFRWYSLFENFDNAPTLLTNLI